MLLGGDPADEPGPLAALFSRAVGRIETNDVDSRAEQLAYGFFRFSGRSERGDDFRVGHRIGEGIGVSRKGFLLLSRFDAPDIALGWEGTPFMPLYQAVILALVQGITEFLPISSSAHLALVPWLLGWKDPGLNFDIALHFGTLAAVVIYFFRDWLQLAARGFGIEYGTDPDIRENPRLLWLLAGASLPIGVAGFLLKEHAETTLRSPWIIGTMLVVVGILMILGERWGTRRKGIRHISLKDALTIGVAQAVAIVPGTSRSGITITAGLFRGLERYASARFSFLLSTPAIAAAAAFAAHDLQKAGGIPAGDQTAFIVGMIVSAITGCLVIAFFLRFLRVNTLRFFIYYRIIFGILVLALAFFRKM